MMSAIHSNGPSALNSAFQVIQDVGTRTKMHEFVEKFFADTILSITVKGPHVVLNLKSSYKIDEPCKLVVPKKIQFILMPDGTLSFYYESFEKTICENTDSGTYAWDSIYLGANGFRLGCIYHQGSSLTQVRKTIPLSTICQPNK